MPRIADGIIFNSTPILYLAAAFLLFSHFAQIVLAYNLGRDIHQLGRLVTKVCIVVVILLVLTIVPSAIWTSLSGSTASNAVYTISLAVFAAFIILWGGFFSLRLKHTIEKFASTPDKLFLRKLTSFVFIFTGTLIALCLVIALILFLNRTAFQVSF